MMTKQSPTQALPFLDYTEVRQRYLPWIKGFVVRYGGDPDHAEDLLHDAWIAMLEKPQLDLSKAKATTYLMGIVKFKWYLELRNKGRFRSAAETMKLDVCIIDDSLELEERDQKVNLLVQKLPSPCQYIIYSIYWLSESLGDVQAKLNHKSRQSTFNAKHRCLQQMKAVVEEGV